MAVTEPLEIVHLEDLPGVAEACRFRRACVDATASVGRELRVLRPAWLRERVRSSAASVVTGAAAAWRSPDWRAARERIAAAERARTDALAALYELYRDGHASSRDFDRVALASASLRLALAALVTEIRERRHEWDG